MTTILKNAEGCNEILNQQSNLLDNSKKVIGGAAGDLARVGAAAGSVLDLSLEQTSNAWDTAGQGQALAYTQDGTLAAQVEDLRDGTLQDCTILQDVANFINPGDGQHVRITEGVTTADGRDVYDAAHQDSNTMFVDIADDRLNNLVNMPRQIRGQKADLEQLDSLVRICIMVLIQYFEFFRGFVQYGPFDLHKGNP